MRDLTLYILEKQSLDLETMESVRRKVIKPKSIRVNNLGPSFLSDRGAKAIASVRYGKSLENAGMAGFGSKDPNKAMAEMLSSPQSSVDLEGKIVPGDNKTLKKFMGSFGYNESSPKTREILNRIAGMHEMTEMHQSKKAIKRMEAGKSSAHFSHISPEVLLQEHNMISSLSGVDGDTKKEVVDIMRKFRDSNGETSVLDPYIPGGYGSGNRISRHDRRKITKKINFKNTLKETPVRWLGEIVTSPISWLSKIRKIRG